MNASTVMGPSAAIRSRSARSSGVNSPLPSREALSDALRAGGRLDARAALARRQHQPQAGDDHRQRQPLAHVQPGRLRERDKLLVGLADELDSETEQAVEEQEGADELARIVPCLGPP